MAGGISASTVKAWFQYRCERKTRYDTMDAASQAAIPLISDQREQLWAKLGDAYEERVVAALAPHVLLPFPGRTILTEEQTRGFLGGAREHRYAAQLNLRPRSPPALLAGSGLTVRQTKPDLVAVDGSGPRPVFKIIDIKATRKATAFHKAQVAFYVLMLRSMLEDLKINGMIDPNGEIWRIPDHGTAEGSDFQVEAFGLDPYLRMVSKFCGEQLGPIASTPVEPGRNGDKTFFHIYFKCEQCAYLPHCSRAILPELPPHQRDVSAVAGVSHEAKRALLANGVRSVADVLNKPRFGRETWWEQWLAVAGTETGASTSPICDLGMQANEVAAAIRQNGVALVTPRFFSAEITSGQLMMPFPIRVEEEGGYWLVHRRGSLPAKTRFFRDWVVDQAAGDSA